MAKSKFFRVGTEGDTTDGRKIERGWIQDMAAHFNRDLYGARVWLEHLRGLYPDSTFRAYGDVFALEAREVEDGKLALFAQIDPTEDLVAMNKARQKLLHEHGSQHQLRPPWPRLPHRPGRHRHPRQPRHRDARLLGRQPRRIPPQGPQSLPGQRIHGRHPHHHQIRGRHGPENHRQQAGRHPHADRRENPALPHQGPARRQARPGPRSGRPQFSADDLEGSFAALAEATAKQGDAFAAARAEDAATIKTLRTRSPR